ncbi:MAG: response regulator [Thermoanaerobaculia bacterium]
MRILIADDHALFRDGLRSLLVAQGHEVIGEAKNGREAIALAHEIKPDLVLMDISMPEVDGLTATRHLTSELPNVKVVVLTASESEASLFDAIKAGAHGYLPKISKPALSSRCSTARARGACADAGPCPQAPS